MTSPTFMDALHSSGPTGDCADKMRLYAWLVGSWEMDAVMHKDDGSQVTTHGSVHAGWVLDGRAIQDVFIVPDLFYGTSLRLYDPHIDAWQIHWIDPLKQVYMHLIGRARGSDIVNEGQETPELARAYGLPAAAHATVHWTFTEITPDSFHWISKRSTDGTTWRRQRDYFARRVHP